MRLISSAMLRADHPTRFALGQVVPTPRALETLDSAGMSLDAFLARHQAGDWGDVSPAQRQLNDQAARSEGHVSSTFVLPHGERLTIFTRGDRVHTLVHVTSH